MPRKKRNYTGEFTKEAGGNKTKERTPSEIRAALSTAERGKLDLRRRMAKMIEDSRNVISECDPDQVAVAVLEQDISVNLAVQRILMEHINKRDELIDEEGQLIPVLATSLLKYQEQNRKAMSDLRRIKEQQNEEDRADKMKRTDVADIILQGGDDETE